MKDFMSSHKSTNKQKSTATEFSDDMTTSDIDGTNHVRLTLPRRADTEKGNRVLQEQIAQQNQNLAINSGAQT